MDEAGQFIASVEKQLTRADLSTADRRFYILLKDAVDGREEYETRLREAGNIDQADHLSGERPDDDELDDEKK